MGLFIRKKELEEWNLLVFRLRIIAFMSHYNNQRKQNRSTYQKPVNLLHGYEA